MYFTGYFYSGVLIRYLVKVVETENRNPLSKTISPHFGDYCSQKSSFMRVHYAVACNIQICIHVWTMTMKRKSMEKKSSLLIIV